MRLRFPSVTLSVREMIFVRTSSAVKSSSTLTAADSHSLARCLSRNPGIKNHGLSDKRHHNRTKRSAHEKRAQKSSQNPCPPSTTTPECLTEIFRGFIRENRPESSQGSTYGELGMYACLLRHSSPFLAFLPSRSVSAQRSSRSRCPFHVFLIIALNTIYSLHSLLCTGAPANT